jgi:hypothetical protein
MSILIAIIIHFRIINLIIDLFNYKQYVDFNCNYNSLQNNKFNYKQYVDFNYKYNSFQNNKFNYRSI